ncbi:MAG: hypothetical protein QM718_14530 [Steroidobacteraceae bacterium]
MIMKNWHRTLIGSALPATLLAVWLIPGMAREGSSLEEANTLVLDAEVALQRGQCSKAAMNYSVLVQRLADAGVAGRATQVALDCAQPQLARIAAQRWVQLAPTSPEALHAGIRAQLEVYDVAAARALWLRWLALPGAAKPDDVAAEIATLAGDADNAPLRRMFDGLPAGNAAMAGASVQLALAQLAFNGFDYRSSVELARKALAVEDITPQLQQEAQWLVARGSSSLGDATAAYAAIDALAKSQPEQAAMARTEVLERLGQDQELAQQLEQMQKSDQAVLRREAQRQLALQALADGRQEQAQQLLEPMLKDENSVVTGVYYMAALAEQRGDKQAALRGYGLLGGTAYDSSARQRMARLLCSAGQQQQALELLAPSADADAPARLQAHIQRSALLADCGSVSEAVSEIKGQLAEYGSDPSLRYQYAVVLERAGKTREAITELENLRKARPQDPDIANALGYTLADHSQQLTRAEQLVRAALKEQPDNPSILDSLAWLQYRRGNARAALPLFERAWRLLENGDIAAHWGEVLWSLDEKQQALEVWQRGARLDPDSELLKKLLQQHPLQPSTET